MVRGGRFDPRCRPWYAGGLSNYRSNPSGSVHYALPSNFTGLPSIDATLPLVDPANDLVALTMIRIPLELLRSSLSRDEAGFDESGFSLFVSANREHSSREVVIGPEFSISIDSGKSLESVLLPHNPPCVYIFRYGLECKEMQEIQSISTANRKGLLKSFDWRRRRPDGTLERLAGGLGPVLLQSILPLAPNDFSRGVRRRLSHPFTIAFLQSEDETDKTFLPTKASLERIQVDSIIALSLIVALAFATVVLISWKTSKSIVPPILDLLSTIRIMNRLV